LAAFLSFWVILQESLASPGSGTGSYSIWLRIVSTERSRRAGIDSLEGSGGIGGSEVIEGSEVV
jgi:hypothetical protein